MLIDTHCHLTDTEDVAGIIARAAAAGVGAAIAVGAHPGDSAKIVALTEQFDNLFGVLGVHPEFAGRAAPDYEHLLNHPKIIGVGEIGLDYYYPGYDRNAQIELFRAQMEIARRHKLPVAIHTRSAADDTAAILLDPEYSSVIGVLHCTYADWDFVKKMMDRGFYISTSGTLTFANKDEARDIFRRAPADRILIETDSPFMAPVPHRGTTCEPAMVIETAKMLADIRGISFAELDGILFENTKRLYPKMGSK